MLGERFERVVEVTRAWTAPLAAAKRAAAAAAAAAGRQDEPPVLPQPRSREVAGVRVAHLLHSCSLTRYLPLALSHSDPSTHVTFHSSRLTAPSAHRTRHPAASDPGLVLGLHLLLFFTFSHLRRHWRLSFPKCEWTTSGGW